MLNINYRKAHGTFLLSRGFKRLVIAVLMTFLWVVPAGVWAANPQQFDITKLTTETKAPDFVLSDLNGQKFRLSDYKGKNPVLLIFSTTWCSFCRAEIPHFKSIYTSYAKLGLEVVNVDIQESKDKVASFASKNELPYRTVLDESGTVSSIFEVRGVPTLVLIDKNGMIVCRQCRNIDTLLKAMMKK
jgi:peroxiredoxin